MNNYMRNMSDTLSQCNKEALNYGCPIAWHNKKIKTFRRHTPRGKTYMKILRMLWSVNSKELKVLKSEMEEMLNDSSITTDGGAL